MQSVGISLSHLSLATLAIQNAALILVMHYSRIMPLTTPEHRYFTSTAVFLNEAVKLVLSIALAIHDFAASAGPETTPIELLKKLYNQVFSSDSWKLAIPAALYTLQNSLQYIAVGNLDAATFQVTYQLKILTTALFSVTMLKRSLSRKQWMSLVLLMFGVAIVQVPTSSTSSDHVNQQDVDKQMNVGLGLTAVTIACAISGLAGVYFEKVLKHSTQVTLWVRNIQLSFYSLFPALLIGVFCKDGAAITQQGFFVGYNWVVWTAIIFQAVGGLLVALVVKYADNIAKNFATSISIVISFIVSIWLFNFTITVWFLAGMGVVIFATYLYSSPDRQVSSTSQESSLVPTEKDEESAYGMEEEIAVLLEKNP